MNQQAMIAAAAASLLSTLLVAAPVAAQEKGKEKCYGVALAGQNDCASFSGLHSCAGQTKANNDIADWKYVAKGTCAGMKGLTAAQAKEKIEMMKKDAGKKS